MKNLIFLPVSLLLTLSSYSQNNAPFAVNDTFYTTFNDSLNFFILSGSTTAGNPNFLINDNDPNGNDIIIDTAIYNGLGVFSIVTDTITSTLYRSIINYLPQLNYYGIDSFQYIIKDNGAPIMYDTAMVYFKVKHQEFEQLDLNNINARLGLYGLFQDVSNGLPAFEVPKRTNQNDPKYTTIFAANLWIAGKHQDSVFANCETYGNSLASNNFYTSFASRSGPIMDTAFYQEYDYKWDRLWKITNNDINYHRNNWNNTGYQAIDVIENWPAHGDTTKGQAYYLAPFIDNNGDGIYNPYDGDYPKIKGQQAVYFIYNDVRAISGSGGSMNTEVHYMAYAYNCPSDSAINNTIFLDYTIYNRSNLTYDSTYIGMWADLDIGNYGDDYVGCDVARSTFYGYNGDANDEGAYGLYPPAQGVTFLKGAKQDNDGIDNPFTPIIQNVLDSSGTPYAGLGTGFGDGIIDNEHWGMEHFIYYNNSGGNQGDPQSETEYYNYLKGFYRDSTQFLWGGIGGTVPAKYTVPGDSDPLWYGTGGIVATPATWSETWAGGDRRGMGSTGPFTFEPGSSIEITLAFVFGRDYQTTGAQAGVIVMQERIDSIRSYYLTDFVSVCGGTLNISRKEKKENSLLVYPNPFNNEITINYNLQNSSATLTIYNLIGKKIMIQNIDQKTSTIDLSKHPNGIYFVTITDGHNRVSKKVIKQ